MSTSPLALHADRDTTTTVAKATKRFFVLKLAPFDPDHTA